MAKKMFYGFLALCFVLQLQMICVSAVKMYSADGRETLVSQSEVEAQKTVGWFTSPPVRMYSADGREILVSQSEVEAQKTVGWFTALPVRVYSVDGRELLISGDEVEIYRNLGWYLELCTMYAPFERTVNVPAEQVQDYVNVGWFTTYEEALYNEVIPQIQNAFSENDYDRVIEACNNTMDRCLSTENVFFEDLESMASAAADAWRATAKQPIAIVSSYVTDYYGTPRVNIVLRNISYKEISAMDLEFNCCNAFGEPVKYYGRGSSKFDGWAKKMYFEPLETQKWHWDLYGYSETDAVRYIKIKRVAFSDGTIWTR